MIDLEKIGKQIATLRKERGFTGEALAERLQVSPQAVSKWENAKCLPETALLPALAEALDCSIDSLLLPKELFILEAVYTDGQTNIPVTHSVNALVRSNTLNIYVNQQFIGAEIKGERLKLLTVKYQTPKGIFFSYAMENESLLLDKESSGFTNDAPFRMIGAWYGNAQNVSTAMQKMEHYEYFKWDRIVVSQETFPSHSASDDTEYLTLVYLNSDGIHTISCPENDTIYYGKNRTQFFLKDDSKCILPGIMRLAWGEGMECPWAGALCAALKYMGEPYTYDQIMGMSGACYRVCFTDVWDYSCTDALVSFDYATPLFEAIGYSFFWAERLEKQERKAERLAIMEDIQNGKPVLAINLRIAPEWGVITGYIDDGKEFLCRTYFDKEVFDGWEREGDAASEAQRETLKEHGGYLVNDFWPFLIMHFGKKQKAPMPLQILKNSLVTLRQSFFAEACRGYHQGKEAYKAWILGLSKEEDFDPGKNPQDNVLRRLEVNDDMLFQLADSRRAAAAYLSESISLLPKSSQVHLGEMAKNCQEISDLAYAFWDKLKETCTCRISYNSMEASGASTRELREEEIALLKRALVLDEENCRLAGLILGN
ncbi:MAG: helix-turn-helix domain-containing protein [Lachnospiraceae bacterium]|nr:helix-turn-helix domain-containing protein [Lachnospiraceae bacterium]